MKKTPKKQATYQRLQNLFLKIKFFAPENNVTEKTTFSYRNSSEARGRKKFKKPLLLFYLDFHTFLINLCSLHYVSVLYEHVSLTFSVFRHKQTNHILSNKVHLYNMNIVCHAEYIAFLHPF